jgi:hypothetical protein
MSQNSTLVAISLVLTSTKVKIASKIHIHINYHTITSGYFTHLRDEQ